VPPKTLNHLSTIIFKMSLIQINFSSYKEKSFEKEVLVITDKKSNSLIPPDTDEKTETPLCLLGEPMKWLGYNPDFKEHYYGCS